MLPLWIAAGIVDLQVVPVTGAIVAVDECTVAAERKQAETLVGTALPYGAHVWPQPFDPGDHIPFAFDFGPLLAVGEKLASIVSIRLSAAAAALGITVDQASGFTPIIDADGGKKVQVWMMVDSAYQENAQFDATGARIAVQFRVLTDSIPPKRFERSGVLVVRQQ